MSSSDLIRGSHHLHFQKAGGFFCPAVLTHKLTGKFFHRFFIACKKIIIITFYNFRINSEIIVLGNKKFLNFEFGKTLLYINNQISKARAITCRIGVVTIKYRNQFFCLYRASVFINQICNKLIRLCSLNIYYIIIIQKCKISIGFCF